MKKKVPILKPSPIEKWWLIEQFNQLHKEHNLILKKISDMQTVINPRLEAAVNAVATQAIKIDRQVPDFPQRQPTTNKPKG